MLSSVFVVVSTSGHVIMKLMVNILAKIKADIRRMEYFIINRFMLLLHLLRLVH